MRPIVRDTLEVVEKSWVGDAAAVGVADHGRAGRG